METHFNFQNSIEMKLGRNTIYHAEVINDECYVFWTDEDDGGRCKSIYTVDEMEDALERGHWIKEERQ